MYTIFLIIFNGNTMRYCLNQRMYHSFRCQLFDFIDKHQKLSNELQKQDDLRNVIRFHYLYEFGPRCQFNQQFRQLWSKYFCDHPILKEKSLILTTKHFRSLNALLAQHK